MRSTLLCTVGASLLAVVAALPTATQIATALQDISVKQRNLIASAQQITILNAPLIVIGAGPYPVIIAGVNEVSNRIQEDLVAQLQTIAPYNGEAAATVVTAYLEFSQSQMDLLAVLNAKVTLIDKVPVVGIPMKAVLQKLEAVDDALAIALINHVEERGAIQSQADAMSSLLDETIRKYASLLFGDLKV